MHDEIVIFWFRRDLRLEDNVGLKQALNSGYRVLPIFIFDKDILERLENMYDRRVDYIHQALYEMNKTLNGHQSSIKTYYNNPLSAFQEIIENKKVHAVYCNKDYEPQAIQRDTSIKDFLKTNGISYHTSKDQVIFEQNEIVKSDGLPYTVYTPYAKKWRAELQSKHYETVEISFDSFYKTHPSEIHSLAEIGFQKTDLLFKTPELNESIIQDYDQFRDYPSLNLTTQLGIALRFGTISIRKCVAFALKKNETWLSELIWREFFMQILFHFPKVVNQSFKPKYDFIEWRNNETEFDRWCKGETGYPIVDAGMRQLNQTGFMHNRVRMIVASFLCKHLLIDWRWGEAYFAEKLNDYDLSANNGNWQWAAGCGCDAAPYFRIFNPTTQTLKFDKDLRYIRTWNPDFEEKIQAPIVEHSFARERCLKTYKTAMQEK